MIRRLAAVALGLALVPAAQAQRVGATAAPCAELPAAPPSVAAYLAQRAAAKASNTPLAPPSAATLSLYTEWQKV